MRKVHYHTDLDEHFIPSMSGRQKLIFVLLTIFLVPVIAGVAYSAHANIFAAQNNEQNPSLAENKNLSSPSLTFPKQNNNILGEAAFNIPLSLNARVTINSPATFTQDVTVKDKNVSLGAGNLTAANVIYSITAGQNIIVSGDSQNPVISAVAPAFPPIPLSVSSLQGKQGALQLTAGTGIGIEGLQVSNSDPGSAQNIFKTIIAGGANITAGSNTDSVSLTAGPGIAISGDTGSKNITITASGNLSGLTTDGILYATSPTDVTSTDAGSNGFILKSNGPGIAPQWVAPGTVLGFVPFDFITSGTNTSASMVVGSGGSLDFTGSGSINASSLLGSTWGAPSAIGNTTPNTGSFTSLSGTSITGTTFNGLTITNNGSNTLAIANGKTLTVNNSLTLAGTDGTTFTFPSSNGTVVTTDATQTLTNKTLAAGSNTITGLTNSNLSGSAGITNANLANSSVTVNSGSGLSGGGSVPLGGSITLTNSGVTSAIAGSGISLSGGTGAVTVTNAGVTSLAGTSNQITVSGATGDVILSLPQNINAGATPTFASLNLTNNTNQLVLGTSNTGTITMSPLGASRTYTLPDASGVICLSGQTCTVSGTLGFFNRNTTTLTPSTLSDRLLLTDGSTADTSNYRFEVNGKQTGKALAVFNETGNQDIFTASASGTTRFIIGNDGTLTATKYTAGVAHFNGSGVVASGQVANSDLANNSITVSAGTGIGVSGSPVALGGTITVSNNGVTLLNSGTGSLTLDNAGVAAGGHITINDASTGQKGIAQFNSTNFSALSGTINTVQNINTTATPTFAGILPNGTTGQFGWFQRNAQVIAPANSTDDLILGGTATGSGKFQIFGITGNATTSGTLTFDTTGTIQTTRDQTLTLGGNATGDIILNPLNAVAGGAVLPASTNVTDLGVSGLQFRNLYAQNIFQNGVAVCDASGNNCPASNGSWTLNDPVLNPALSKFRVGIGTTNTGNITSELFVTRTLADGALGKALAVFNQTENQDILTASASGVTKFTITNAGNVTASGTITGSNFSGTSSGTNTGDVTLSGENYLSLAGQVLTANAVNLGGTNVSGTLAAARFGALTGDVTNSAGSYATTIAANAITTGKILDNTIDFADISNSLTLDANTSASFGNNVLTLGDQTGNGNLLVAPRAGGQAALIVNKQGANDIFSASSSGTTKFTISNSGNVTASGTLSGSNFSGISSGTNTGDVTLSGENYLSLAGQALTANAVNLSGTNVTGTLAAARFGALTGDVTNSAGSYATTIANNAVTTGKILDNTIDFADISNALTLDANTAASFGNNVLTLGDTTGNGNLVVAPNAGGQAALIVNKQGNNDIFSASSSGTTKFTINSSGNLAIAGSAVSASNYLTAPNFVLNTSGQITTGTWQATAIGTQFGGTGQNFSGVARGAIPYFSNTGVMNTLAAGSAGNCLVTNGAGADPSWGSCGTASNFWQLHNGSISPFSNTLDLLIGNTATTSANFAFINNVSGTPTATISGNLSLITPKGANPAATFNILNGGSLNFQTSAGGDAGLLSTLFLGNNGFVGVNTTTPASFFEVAAYESRFNFIDHPAGFGADIGGGMTLTEWDTTDPFVYLNGYEGKAGFVFENGNGTNELMRIDGNGSVGIGASASAKLDVHGFSGTQPVTNLTGTTAKSALIVNNSGVGDLFTASKSGATKFVISNAGNVGIGVSNPGATLDLGSGTIQGAGLTDCNDTSSTNSSTEKKLQWDSTTKQFSCANDGASILVRKSADQSNNSNTFSNGIDSELTFAVSTSETYIFHMSITQTASSTQGFRYEIVAPTGATCKIASIGADGAGSASELNNAGCGTVGTYGDTSGNGEIISLDGTVVTDGTHPGSVTLQFANNGSGTGTVKAGSSLVAYKVNGADVAEAYYTKDTTIQPGDIVQVDGSLKAGVKKTETAYDQHALGIISTKPSIVLGDDTASDRPVFLALSGRVPVKVSSMNGPIEPGDYLTTSSISGVAMKATHAGQMIGKALESYTSDNPDAVGTILVFTNLSWADPLIITDDGNLSADALPFSVTASSLPILNKNLQDLDATVSAIQTQTNIQSSQISSLNDQVASIEAKLTHYDKVILGSDTNGLTYDSSASAWFDATVFNDRVATSSSFAKVASKLDTVNQRLSFLELQASGSALLGNVPDSFTASSSTQLNLDQMDIKNATVSGTLNVLGRTVVSDLGITGRVTAGLLTIDGLDTNANAAINTTSGPLKLQSDGLNGIDLVNGNVTIDTQGNIKTDGEITTKKINIKSNDVAAASLGEVVLKANQTTVTVKTTALTNQSRIFIQAEDVPVTTAVKRTGNDTFEIKTEQSQNDDVKLQWWIIN